MWWIGEEFCVHSLFKYSGVGFLTATTPMRQCRFGIICSPSEQFSQLGCYEIDERLLAMDDTFLMTLGGIACPLSSPGPIPYNLIPTSQSTTNSSPPTPHRCSAHCRCVNSRELWEVNSTLSAVYTFSICISHSLFSRLERCSW